MGTALTDEQVAELGRLARVVLLAFDADRSGREAMLRVQRAAAARQLALKVIPLPDDKDPCDLLHDEGADAFAARVEEAISFLEFQVRTVIENADLSSPTGKDRALAELSPIFGQAAPSAERDEQIRHVAGRLDLSEHLLTPLIARPRQGPTTRPPVVRAHGAAARGERWERIFLAMCVSGKDRGRDYLERLMDDHLSSEVLRRARTWILEHFDAPTTGLRQDDELAQAVGEIVVRASSQPANDHALEVGFLGLERRRLERAIKAAGEAEEFERQQELSLLRNEATEGIVRLMGGGQIAAAAAEAGSVEQTYAGEAE
jgi:DNA primase